MDQTIKNGYLSHDAIAKLRSMTVPDIFDVYAGSLENDSRDNYQRLLREYTSKLPSHWTFEIVQGFFKQSDESTDVLKFNYLDNFGRLLTWEEIFTQLKALNEQSAENECYKVLFLARHGQGFHNVANSKYGQKAWDEKWSMVNTDGEITWGPDPKLTEVGINQAIENGKAWDRELKDGCEIPTKWFTSPMSRSIDTMVYTWEKIVDLKDKKPLIMEDLRETFGVPSDKRSSKEQLKKYGFEFHQDFKNEDTHVLEQYESIEHHLIRINRAFQYIFDNYHDQVISITSHSGSIRSQLLVLGHREFAIGTGGMIPVFVKATKIMSE